MAITRSQQAKQMLQDGGMLVKPSTDGKRPGYRSARAQSAQGRTGGSSARERGAERSRSSNTSSKSSTTNTGGGNRRESYITNYSSKGIVKGGGKKVGVDKDGSPIFEDSTPSKEVRDRQRTNYQDQFTSKGIVPPGPNRKARQRALNFINRNLLTSYNRFTNPPTRFLSPTGYPNFGIPVPYQGIYEALQSGLTLDEILENENRIPLGKSGLSYELNPIPDLDIDSIRELASTQTTLGGSLTGYQADQLGKIRKNIEKRDNLFETGDTSDIFPKPPEPRPDDGPSDPCLGPNPPAYCFIGEKADETQEAAITRNLAGLTPRIGGSIFDFTGLADGGIADLAREEMFVGGLVKGVKKGLKGITRGIKKVAKSPIGKLALAAAAGGYGFGLGPFKGMAGSGFLKGSAVKNFLFKDGVPGLSNLSGKGIASIIGGASLLPLLMGAKEEDEFDIDAYYAANRLNPNAPLNMRIAGSQFAANGGRIGYDEAGAVMSEKEMKKLAKSPLYKGFKKMYGVDPSMAKENPAYEDKFNMFEKIFKKGFAEGGEVEPVAKKTLPLLDMGGMEKDYRAEGGFVPIGRMEKADDVPARLSKNEFVFTAEAVRNAGDGDVDKGAEVMYNMMKNLESGGDVSEESQGLKGAREMFQTSQRLGEVI